MFATLAGHMAWYGSWIVDDAGITFAYARNVAAGHGWVSFPGEAPVEGFTNLLWLLALLPTFACGLFDPVVTPKLLGFACAFGALLLTRRAIRSSRAEQRLWGDVGLVLVAANPSFAIWCASGLENGLFALLVACLLAASARIAGTQAAIGWQSAAVAGLVATATAATRPDGLVLAALWPATVLVCGGGSSRHRLRLAALASGVTILGVLGLTAWRWHTFGDVVPNTFRAKVGDSWPRAATASALAIALLALQLLRWRLRPSRQVFAGIIHAALVLAVLVITGSQGVTRSLAADLGAGLIAITFGLGGRHPPARTAPWVLGTILALSAFRAMPPDWMGEYRFGTPFLLIATPWLTIELGAARALTSGRPRALLTVLLAALLVSVVWLWSSRAARFQNDPTVPMADVEAFHARVADWAAAHSLRDISVMTADVGGALWLARHRIVDLAGLCDAEIARRIGRREDLSELVLARRPTFVELHGHFANTGNLGTSATFRDAYVPIEQAAPDAALRAPGSFYLRRDHAPTDGRRR
ncbi:MAG: hypothetical protein H6838_02420 [Planctomycetes bacterium]|nr:hypothetical protein [Planctomycetota bacterium]